MNKKVLTLCAGFLLAGGMLSSLSAETLEQAAGTGKYYKMVRTAYKTSAESNYVLKDAYLGTKEDAGTDYFGVNVVSATDYWKVEGNATDGYTLTNLEGQVLKVGDTEAFIEDPVSITVDGENYTYSQLTLANGNFVGVDGNSAIGEDFYKVAERTTGQYNAEIALFDADLTALEAITAIDALENGKTYRFKYFVEGRPCQSEILKASFDESNDTWSFIYNADDETLVVDKENDFKVEVTEGGVYFTTPSGDKFISRDEAGNWSLVTSVENATLFAFDETSEELSWWLTASQLNWYEKDGFSVTIKYQDEDGNFTKTDIKDNPFVGHLTPMIYLAGKMQPATGGQTSFFLKNEEGKYIVAKANMVGQQKQSYKFETISETDLLRELSVNTVEKTYFGVFAADALQNEYEKDVQALSQLANLYVVVGDDLLRVGNLEENDVPTLKAATDYYWSGLGLKPVKIELGGGT